MFSLLLCVALSQGPGYDNSEMVFMRDSIGQLWARHRTEKEWAPVRGEAPRGIRVESASTQYYTSGTDEPPMPLPTTPTATRGHGSGTGRGDGAGGGKIKMATVPAVARPRATTQSATPEATIKKLAAAPKPPNNANGKERAEYTNKQIGTLESQFSDLRNEVASLRDALQGIVAILEKR